MALSCADLSEIVDQLLEQHGYTFHAGPDDDTHWFAWAAPGMAAVEVSATHDEPLAATIDALGHFFVNAEIKLETIA